jgi:hypothetical protein
MGMHGPASPKGLPDYGELRRDERQGEQLLSVENGAGRGRIGG